jgi:hypothetical protein
MWHLILPIILFLVLVSLSSPWLMVRIIGQTVCIAVRELVYEQCGSESTPYFGAVASVE